MPTRQPLSNPTPMPLHAAVLVTFSAVYDWREPGAAATSFPALPWLIRDTLPGAYRFLPFTPRDLGSCSVLSSGMDTVVCNGRDHQYPCEVSNISASSPDFLSVSRSSVHLLDFHRLNHR
ncbi:hypothetical protein DPEC_G00266310 [Dallia pectoralis]|uniref:Uncharacterized protein n=1 Tax=Dallia pectoralis TaxID=75939 RepID=A0ACC2FNA4_DALPE|nr:hypothetical protein DPEC_G00266310 [Dallia pectoralis]